MGLQSAFEQLARTYQVAWESYTDDIANGTSPKGAWNWQVMPAADALLMFVMQHRADIVVAEPVAVEGENMASPDRMDV